jgi:hypothetical protein
MNEISQKNMKTKAEYQKNAAVVVVLCEGKSSLTGERDSQPEMVAFRMKT